jgi:hypothetical protein
VISLAFDPDAGGDRLFAIELDDDLFGMFTCLVDVGIPPPCFSELFVIDPSDASITVLGELNSAIVTGGYPGMAWHDDDAELYIAGPPGMRSVDLASCNGSSCPTIGAVDSIFRSSASLTWDPTTGLLIRAGGLFSGTLIDHHDPATGETRPSRGIDVYTPGGLAALPEPGVTSGLGAGILALAWLKRRRELG